MTLATAGREHAAGTLFPSEADWHHTSGIRSAGVFGELRDVSHRPVGSSESHDSDQAIKEMRFSDSIFGRVAKSSWFEQTTIFVIMLNAVEIGWDADYSARWQRPDNLFEGPLGFIVTSVFFCTYFTLEILIRFLGFRVKLHCCCDLWFVFDTVLVCFMVAETAILPFIGAGGPLGGLSILRLLRLLRIARMAKLMHAFPQLMMIVHGISAALKAVVWSAILLVIVTLTAAIVFTSTFHQGSKSDAEVVEQGIVIEEFFGSMGKSMLSLLIMGTILDDVTACTDAIRATGNTAMLVCFLLYILLNSFTMLNMLTGILVEVVGNTSESESKNAVEQNALSSVLDIFVQMDEDGSGKITQNEFRRMKEDREVMSALDQLGVLEKHFDMFVELLFTGSGKTGGEEVQLDFQDLLESIRRLRPGATISALDFAAFRRAVLADQEGFRFRIQYLDNICRHLSQNELPEPGADDDGLRGADGDDGGDDGEDGCAASPVSDEVQVIENAEAEYIVDNSILKAKSKGLRHRRTKHLDDLSGDDGGTAWGGAVRGVDEGDGWLRLPATGTFVPFSVNGVPVLFRRAEAELLAAKAWSTSGEQNVKPKRISAAMLTALETTASYDIIGELQRRLGLANLEETGVPMSMMDEELQNWVKTAEAFQKLGTPQNEDWLLEAMPC